MYVWICSDMYPNIHIDTDTQLHIYKQRDTQRHIHTHTWTHIESHKPIYITHTSMMKYTDVLWDRCYCSLFLYVLFSLRLGSFHQQILQNFLLVICLFILALRMASLKHFYRAQLPIVSHIPVSFMTDGHDVLSFHLLL